MNKARRKNLQTIIDAVGNALSDLEAVKDEEQECYDNIPESLQVSEKGERMYEIIDVLESAILSLDEAINYMEEATE